jgi:mRNA interferase YafQ
MYEPNFTGKFKKDVKLCVKRGWDKNLLDEAIRILLENGCLPSEYLPHPLTGTNNDD